MNMRQHLIMSVVAHPVLLPVVLTLNRYINVTVRPHTLCLYTACIVRHVVVMLLLCRPIISKSMDTTWAAFSIRAAVSVRCSDYANVSQLQP